MDPLHFEGFSFFDLLYLVLVSLQQLPIFVVNHRPESVFGRLLPPEGLWTYLSKHIGINVVFIGRRCLVTL